MRVLELRQSLRYGNLERLIVGTAACLRPAGFELEVLLLYNRNRASLLGERTPLPEVHPLIADAAARGVPAYQEADMGRLSPQPLRAILRHVRHGRFDLIHTHDFKTDVLGLLAGKRAGVPVVATAHGYPRAIWRNDLYRALDLLTLRLYPHVVCVSEGLQRELMAAGIHRERISVVYNGIDADAVRRMAAAMPHTLRQDLRLDATAPIVMAVGRLSREKGLSYLQAAVQEVAPRRPDVHLVVVGDGPERDGLMRQARELGIADRVHFTGFRSDAIGLLDQCDIVVVPSLQEALGNVALEAMALGKPVIGTTAGGLPEVIKDAETGFIVPAGSSKALGECILQLLNAPEQARRLGEQGRRVVLSRFTVERMAEGLATVFGRLHGAVRT